MITLLILINMLRTEPLRESLELNLMAQHRAEYLCAHPLSHQGFDQEMGLKYKYQGENIAQGYEDDLSAHLALMNSPTHMANLLSPHYTQLGIGQACDVRVELFASDQIEKWKGIPYRYPQN